MGEIVTVNFRGDELYGFKQDDGTFLALKPMVEAMGLSWSGQYERVQRDPVLSEGIRVTRTPFGRGGSQECVCIRLDLVNGWLFGIDSSRIKDEEVRAKVVLYQRECYQVLHDHFAGKAKGLEFDGELNDDLTMGEKLRLVTEARQSFDSQAAREMWFKQGLPIVPSMLKPSGQLTFFDYGMIKQSQAAA